ncbi:MAG TPA: hypothetical protein VJT33_04080 [bacterium]|nr:hypothetical protein [bacterium]
MAARLTRVSIKTITVNSLTFVGERKTPSYDLTFSFEVDSPFGSFPANIQVPNAASLDDALGQALQELGRWGSGLFDAIRQAFSAQIS